MKIERSQSVYVVFNPDTNRTKVGTSENVMQCLNGLIFSSGSKLQLIYNTDRILNYGLYKTKIHEKLKGYNYLGEWFSFDCNKIKDIVIDITKAAPIDRIISEYKKGVLVNDLSKMFGLSRSGIVKHLKQSQVWSSNTFESVITPDKGINDTFESVNIPQNDINSTFKSVIIAENDSSDTFKSVVINKQFSSQYNKRIQTNIYTNDAKDKYIYRVFKNGDFYEAVFYSLDECRNYLNQK